MIARSPARPVISAVARGVNVVLGSAFNPRSLFRLGEQGVWYDPNDFSSMFQDSTGTTPVTAAGQPAGLILDKRFGLVRGVELLANGGFSTDLTNWISTDTGIGVSSWEAGALRVNGTDATTNRGARYQPFATVVGRTYEITGTAQITSGSGGALIGNSGMSGGLLSRPITSSGSWRAVFVATASVTYVSLRNGSSGGNLTFDSISIREIPGNHAAQSLSASQPILRQNALTGAYYLEFDGIDDFLLTSSIDFTGTDKVSVFAGVRKLIDSAPGTLLELSANSNTNPGTFAVFAPVTTFSNYAFRSFGSVTQQAQTSSIFPAPISNVLAMDASISGDRNVLRANGAQVAANAGDQGTGNYGNYPLYIGRRAGATLAFNGHLYGLIVRGALTSDALTRSTELSISRAIGVPLQ